MAETLSTMSQVVLNNGCRIVLEAIDPATGNPVSGVVVSAVAIYATDVSPVRGEDDSGEVVPLLTSLSLDDQAEEV